MISLSGNKQADVIDVFNTTSRYFDDMLNINNVYFDNMLVKYIPDKKRNAPLRFFPLSSPFNTKMLIVMKYSFLIKFY